MYKYNEWLLSFMGIIVIAMAFIGGIGDYIFTKGDYFCISDNECHCHLLMDTWGVHLTMIFDVAFSLLTLYSCK